MSKKFWVGLLILTFVLGSLNLFWSKPAQANTEEKRRDCVCAAEPWHEGEWNKATPPTGSDQNQAYSSANSVKPRDKVDPRKVQQKPQRSFWSGVQFFLYNLKLLSGGK